LAHAPRSRTSAPRSPSWSPSSKTQCAPLARTTNAASSTPRAPAPTRPSLSRSPARTGPTLPGRRRSRHHRRRAGRRPPRRHRRAFRLAHAFIRLRPLRPGRARGDQRRRRPPGGRGQGCHARGAVPLWRHALGQCACQGTEGDRSAARAHLAQAGAIADRIGEDRNDYNTEFGPTNVLVHRSRSTSTWATQARPSTSPPAWTRPACP
jgi:hypothetical protein